MKNYYFFFGEGSKINQIICSVLITLPVFAYGAGVGWISPMTLLLQSDKSPTGRPLSDTEISWIAAVAYLVCAPSDFLVAAMAEKLGRKITLLFISSASVACWVIMLFSMETWAFILARSLFGITMAGSYVVCPMYNKEISEDSIRGILGSLVILFHTSGNLFMYIIGDILSYRTLLWICMAIPTIHLVLFMMMPESPPYLIKQGKNEEAIRVMAWLRCRNEDDPIISHELDLIRKEQQKDAESSKYAFKSILKDKILFRAFVIVIVISLAREVCGAIPVINFAGDIFKISSEGSGLVLSPNHQAMMLGAIQVLGSLLASSIVEKTGRKPLLFVTSFIAGISMCALASWFLVRQNGIIVVPWLPIATLCICIFCDASGLQPLSVVLNAEMFSYRYRGLVMATTMGLASILAFAQTLFFKPLINSIGIQAAFFFFGFICLGTSLFTILKVPETKMRTIAEIHYDLKTKKEKAMDEIDLKKIDAVK